MKTAISMDSLIDGFDWVCAAGPFENRAVINRETGAIYLIADADVMDEQDVPDDIDDGSRYVDIPQKNDLDLGRDLALRFAQEQLPESYELVEAYFAKRGAYSRFKAKLAKKGRLDAWYQFEEDENKRALREWAEGNGLQIAPEGSDQT